MSGASSQLNDIVLRAGAGAGKTTTLTETFLRFASDFKIQQGRFPRIVVTTFTRKATQELKERLLSKSLAEGREDLFHYVSAKSQVQISTIHGVLSLFLSRYGASLGLTPDYRILSEAEVRRGARKIMRQHLLENEELQELLEEYDFSALEKIMLEYFSHQLIDQDLKFITQEELQKKTDEHLQRLSGHLREICSLIAQESDSDVWTAYAQELGSFSWQVVDGNYQDLYDRLENFFESKTKPIFRKASPPFPETLNEDFSELRKKIDKLIEEPRFRPEFWQKHQRNCELFQKLADKFCQDFYKTKIENGFLSMGDLETLSFKITRDHPEAAERFSQEWDFWMIDEYQDTSPLQVELLHALVGSRPSFVVGDPQQSIYLFRGARSEVFKEKERHVESKGGKLLEQRVNYRSTPEVLHFFNFYFSKLGPQFAPMTPAPDKKPSENKEPVVQVILSEEKEDEDSAEALAVVARIQELIDKGLSPEKICVLGRTHRSLEEIAKKARDFGVPVQLHSGGGFFERREIIDALALLKFLINPHDNFNFVLLLRSPWCHLQDDEILKFCHGSRHSYWREAQKAMASLTAPHPLLLLRDLLLLAEEQGYSATLKKALIELGIFDYSGRIDITGRREANLWKLVSMLSEEERRPGFNFLDFMDSSLEDLSADEASDDSEATPVIEPRRVNFMTVHASKGLQFEHIILPAMGQDPRGSMTPLWSVQEKTGLWTLKVRDESQAMKSSLLAEQILEELKKREAEEFNRVLYVALTRAKSGVTLVWDDQVGKRSWASSCPLNLSEGLHEETNFSYLVRKDNPLPQQYSESMMMQKQPRDLWAPPSPAAQKITVSVTELVAPDMKDSNAKVYRRDVMADLERAQQGTEAHRLFEALKYNAPEKIADLADDKIKKALQFVTTTKDIPLFDVIRQGFVEWGFALQYQGRLLQGQIDLWGLVDGTLWVVDYKTGSQKYSDVALKQLQVYAWALHRMGYAQGASAVKLAVVYPLDEKIKVENVGSFSTLESKTTELFKQSSVS